MSDTHGPGVVCTVDHAAYLRMLRAAGESEALIDALAGVYTRLHLDNTIAAIEIRQMWVATESEDGA